MPLYEYKCRDCETPFETIVSSGDTVRCPECESENLDRLISTFAVRGGSSGVRSVPAISSGGT